MAVETVNHPRHYNLHASGVEAIDLCEHLFFSLGNAIKYLWRAGLKGDAVEDLKKAAWYLRRDLISMPPSFVPPPAATILAQRVIAAESEGSVLRDVLSELIVSAGWTYKGMLQKMIARVEREIEARSK